MRSTRMKALLALGATAGAWASADARRTEIDSNGTTVYQGYCDLNGDDCTPVSLGYSVDFGSGPLSSVLIYGNGLLTFGNTVAKFGDFSNSLADYGVPTVSLGLNSDTTTDFFGSNDEVFLQTARLTLGPAGQIDALWEICRVNTVLTCTRQYELTLTKTALGYDAVGIYDKVPQTLLSGFSVPGGTTDEAARARTAFSIPATFGIAAPVPEPATWATLVLGFGLIGGTLRRKAVANRRAATS